MNSPHLFGDPLAENDYRLLERSFISRELADAANLRRVTDSEAREVLGIDGRNGNFAGILFPYHDPWTGQVTTYRLRRDQPDLEERNGKVVDRAKYLSCIGGGNHVYVPPSIPGSWIDDGSIPIVICEGEKKGLALWHIIWQCLRQGDKRPRFLPIALSGVWSWRGRIGKAPTPSGGNRDVRGVIPSLQRIKWQGRQVTILFDSNTHTNEDVRAARKQLAGWLTAQGANARLADLPLESGVNGLDDAAGKHGAEYILKLLGEASSFERGDIQIRVLSSNEERVVREQPYRGMLYQYEQHSRARLPEIPVEYHTITGLVLEAGVLAGKLKTDFGLKCNLAGVIVAFQGSGKSLPSVIARDLTHPIEQDEKTEYYKSLRSLKGQLEGVKGPDRSELENEISEMERAGRPAIIVATQASVEGLLEALVGCPSGIADFDEFGAFLKDCRREHMRSGRENFIKALDGRPIFYRRTRGRTVDVPDPALSMWGTVNVESLRVASDDEDMFGGLFSRILFCAPDYAFSIPFPQPGSEEQAEQLRLILRAWRKMDQVQVKFEPEVHERAREYAYTVAPYRRGEKVDITKPEDQAAAVGYVRYAAHAHKVAILLAASEVGASLGIETKTLTVSMRHMLLAINQVEQFRRQTVRLLRHLEKMDPLVADVEKFVAKISTHPYQDRSYYQRVMRWDCKHFGQVAAEAERSNRVGWNDEPSTGGRKRRVYSPRSAAKHANY